jgi:cytochrome d ubiquinol oxidase subunit II
VKAGRIASLVAAGLFVLAGFWVAKGIDGYVVTSALVHDGPSNPLGKEVARQAGAWMQNYRTYPWTTAAPVLAVLALLIARSLLPTKHAGLAFIASGVGVASIIATAGFSLFPFMLPSSIEPRASLTVWDSSSSRPTLMIMLAVTVIFLPIIVAYTTWVYRILRGRVTAAFVEQNGSSLY